MIENNTQNQKVSTKSLLVWSIALLVIGFAPLYAIRYKYEHTPCSGGECETLTSVAHIVQPAAGIVFLVGAALLLTVIIVAIVRRIRR